MARRRSGYVTVDVYEVIDAIDDEDLLEEVKSRKLIIGTAATDFIPEDDIREAYEELLRGRASEALAILDRLVHPKWGSVKAAQAAWQNAVSPSEGERK